MQVTSMILADFAIARDGVLNVVGGGINRLARSEFPARMEASLALMISPDNVKDLTDDHLIEVIIADTSKDARIAHFRFKWPGISSSEMPAEPLPSIPLVVPTRNIKLPHAGLYRLFVTVDTRETGHLEFKATQASNDSFNTSDHQTLEHT
jgi:hypothetical protein